MALSGLKIYEAMNALDTLIPGRTLSYFRDEFGFKCGGTPGMVCLCWHVPVSCRLTGCGLTPACCEDLSVVITTNQSLTELNINQDVLGDSGMKRLHDAVRSASCKLHPLL